MDTQQRLSPINTAVTSHQSPSAASADDDEDALSLSDLPLIHQSTNKSHSDTQIPSHDFDFCPNQQSEMCAADEVFYQGQILPLRHSLSSGANRFPQISLSRSISRSESMDYPSSAGVFTSRSSSISSSSTSTAASAAGAHKKTPLNLFHSHPSPSPKLQTAARTNSRNCTKKSSPWNIFRLGLLTNPPKIAFNDLKSRGNNNNSNCKNSFGSRNSNSSNSSSNSDQKKKGGSNLLGGCNCALDAVDTVAYNNKVGFMKRSMSNGSGEMRVALQVEEESLLAAAPKPTKKRVSNHRTFEWLKQLSIDGAPDEH